MIAHFKQSICFYGAIAVLAAWTPSFSQERPVEGAQQFLAEVSTRGATRAHWFPTGGWGRPRSSQSGRECETSFTLGDGRTVRVDWSKVSSIRYNSNLGGILISAGDFPSWELGIKDFRSPTILPPRVRGS